MCFHAARNTLLRTARSQNLAILMSSSASVPMSGKIDDCGTTRRTLGRRFRRWVSRTLAWAHMSSKLGFKLLKLPRIRLLGRDASKYACNASSTFQRTTGAGTGVREPRAQHTLHSHRGQHRQDAHAKNAGQGPGANKNIARNIVRNIVRNTTERENDR